MPFTALIYYFFLALVAVVHFLLPARWRPALLLVASYAYYVSFRPWNIVFLLTTTCVSYASAMVMKRFPAEGTRKAALCLALGVELCLLGLTKYWDPVANATGLFGPLNLLVPLGISFYTFQTIGYLVDVHRRAIEPETRFVHHALFLGFFPHLLAGPIEPAAHFLPQIQKPHAWSGWHAALGAQLILTGLFKKFVIAEGLAPVVNLVFGDPSAHAGAAAAFAVLLARWRIYADFSGYTDIALGSAAILGYRLSPNFRRPFFASSISDYWRRWHISLSNWIRTYIFYPLVTSPFSRFGVSGIVIITFLVLGLWHGGTINFLIYGLWQGAFVALDLETKHARERFYKRSGLARFPRLLNAGCVLFTFFLIVVPPTLFFQAPTFATSRAMLGALFAHPWSLADFAFLQRSEVLRRSLFTCAIAIAGLELFDWAEERFHVVEGLWRRSRALFSAAGVVLLWVILEYGHFASDSSFVYMKF